MNRVPKKRKSQTAEEIYKSLPNGENKYDGSVIRFVNATFGKIIRHQGYDTKKIIPQLKEIFDNSVPLNFEEDTPQPNRPDGSVHKKHDNFKGYHNYLGKFNDGQGDYFVRFTIQEQKTRKKDYIAKELHSTYISEIEIYKADQSVSAPKIIPWDEREIVSSNDKLMRIIAKIKSEAENSSKIVDKNGEPLAVYHGTTSTEPFYIFEKGDVGFHFGTEEQAKDRATDETVASAYLSLSAAIPCRYLDNQNHRLSRWYAPCLQGDGTGSPIRTLSCLSLTTTALQLQMQ